MLLDGGKRLFEPPLDGLRQLAPQVLELGEAPLQVLALRLQLREPLLLGLVLLFRERVDLPQRLVPAPQALEPLAELLAVVALRRFRAGRLEPTPRLLGLGL